MADLLSVTQAVDSGIKSGIKGIRGGINKIQGTETEKKAKNQKAGHRGLSTFGYKSLNYPGTLEADATRTPYWMTIYILKQELSHFSKGESNTFVTDLHGQRVIGTADRNARAGKNLNKNFGGLGIGFGRKAKRTQRAIRLYLPDTLTWSYENEFKDVSISGLPGMAILSAISAIPKLYESATEAAKKGGFEGILSSFASPAARVAGGAAAEFLGELSGGGANFGLSVLGMALNPQIDVIYETPKLRTFNFDFLFAPKNEHDAATLAQIIYELKFHSAPEMHAGGIGIGRYYVPPSEFDIEFSVNSMGKISTCVLQNLTVDYAPSGAAFYNNDQPVNTRLVLSFKELEFMTKELIDEGF